MKPRKKLSKRRGSGRRGGISIRASAEEPQTRHKTVEEILGLYKPRKRRVTLRLDADVLEWFREPGRGYQTRINRALRNLMKQARGKPGDKA
jgi:uncharacterized protein (DUF4415 family)